MNLRRLVSRSLLAALALAAAGCASVNTVEPLNPEGKPQLIPDKRVINNTTLNEIAYVVEVDGSRTPDGQLRRVQVKLYNKKNAVKNVNYNFQWFDAQGFALDREPTQVVVIEGGDTRAVQDTATSPSAVDWKLTLSESTAYTPGSVTAPSPTRR